MKWICFENHWKHSNFRFVEIFHLVRVISRIWFTCTKAAILLNVKRNLKRTLTSVENYAHIEFRFPCVFLFSFSCFFNFYFFCLLYFWLSSWLFFLFSKFFYKKCPIFIIFFLKEIKSRKRNLNGKKKRNR